MLKLQRATTAQTDLANIRMIQSNGMVSRATTAQSNVSRKKYRVTTVLRERKSTLNSNVAVELAKSQMQYTDRDKNNSFLKDIPKLQANFAMKKSRPYKSEIQLNKLTMGFLNYDKLKEFYKEEKSEVPIRRETDSSPRMRQKYNPDTDKDLNLFEYFNLQTKNGGFRLGMNLEGGLKRQSMDIIMVPSIQQNDVIFIFYTSTKFFFND